ncbi:MAG: ATP:cob(I)alamin adenosyltransferase [Spirochaetia bacterium]
MAGFDRITTRAGDDGTSSLPGLSGLSKDDILFQVLGDLDELSAALGLARSTAAAGALPGGARAEDIRRRIEWMQSLVARVLSAVAAFRAAGPAGGGPQVPENAVSDIEHAQGELMSRIPIPDHFIMPGGTRLSAEIHVARGVCRRAERSCVKARNEYGGAGLEAAVPVLNRLSDYAFVLALAADPDPGAGRIETA